MCLKITVRRSARLAKLTMIKADLSVKESELNFVVAKGRLCSFFTLLK